MPKHKAKLLIVSSNNEGLSKVQISYKAESFIIRYREADATDGLLPMLLLAYNAGKNKAEIETGEA